MAQDIEESEVPGRGVQGVDDGEGEFAFGEVFGDLAFVRVVHGGGEVGVVVEDLEEGADGVGEGDVVGWWWGGGGVVVVVVVVVGSGGGCCERVTRRT